MALFSPAELEELRRADAEIDAASDALTVEERAASDRLELQAAVDRAGGVKAKNQHERRLRQGRESYQRNKAKRLEYQHKYWRDNRERLSRMKHEYYLAHKAEYRERSRKWYHEHPGYNAKAAQRERAARRKDKENGNQNLSAAAGSE